MPTKTAQQIDKFGRVVLRVFECHDGSAQSDGATFTIYREQGKRQVWRSYYKPCACVPGDVRFSSIKLAVLDIPVYFQEVC